jgi:hypothetical protein
VNSTQTDIQKIVDGLVHALQEEPVAGATLQHVVVSRRPVLKFAAVASAVFGLGVAAPALLGQEVGLKAAPGNQLRIPAGVRLRGTNISPVFADIIPADQGSVWAAMWRTWDWTGRIKPQIDDAAKIGNAIRFPGNTACMAQGTVAQATYLARWKQVLDYCVSKNLYVYPVGGDLGHWGDFSYSDASTLFTAWADLLHAYPNTVVGVDITDEAWGEMQPQNAQTTTYKQPENYIDMLDHIGHIVRDHAKVPVTHSFPLTDVSWWTLAIDPVPRLFWMSDYLDYHIYCGLPDPPGGGIYTTPSQAAQAFTTPWGKGKRMMVGGFGANMTLTSSQRIAQYQQVCDIFASQTDIKGVFNWACWDLGNTPSDQWGLYDGSRQLRADISTPFATIPTNIPMTG